MKRQQLERRLKSLTKQGQPEFEQEIYDDVIESDTQPDGNIIVLIALREDLDLERKGMLIIPFRGWNP